MSEFRILTNEQEIRGWAGDRLFEELCALARASDARYDLPVDWSSPGPRGGRRSPFGSLEPGDRFYVRGEFWAPRERHEKWRGPIREPVREVLEARASANGTKVLTNEEGVEFVYSPTSAIYLVDDIPASFPSADWLPGQVPWVAPTLRRLGRENRARFRVDPGAACAECDGLGIVGTRASASLCPRCLGRRPECAASVDGEG